MYFCITAYQNTMKVNTTIILFILLLSLPTFAQWTPFVQNADKTSQMQSSQTWCISPYNNQWVFFANDKSLVQFDGNIWTHFNLNNQSSVRSVHSSVKHKKIFVGGINELGYFAPQENGSMVYTCISDSLPYADRFLGNVWDIGETSAGIYFLCDNCVVRWHENNATVISANDKKLVCMAVVNDVPYVGTDNGIWMIVGNSLFAMQHTQTTADWYIRCLKPFRDGLLVGMMRSGLYYADKNKITPFRTPADEQLKTNELFCLDTHDNIIAAGTIQNGLLIIDTNTNEVININEGNGLKDNTVLSVSFDNAGNVWAGLDRGLSYAMLNMPISDLQTNGLSFGSGYAVAVKDNLIYLGTNRGLYVANFDANNKYKISNIQLVENSGGQVWSLQKVGDELFCLHDKGLMIVNNHTCTEIEGMTGAWCCQPIVGRTDMMFIGSYQGLYVACKENGHWRISHKVENANGSFEFIEQESARIVWYCDGTSIVRLVLDNELKTLQERTVFDETDGVHGMVLTIAIINGRICAETSNGLYRYNHHNHLFDRATTFETQLANHSGYQLIKEANNKLLSIKKGRISIGNVGNNLKNVITIPINQDIVEMPKNFINIFPISDTAYIFPTCNGFALLETQKIRSGQSFHNHSFGINKISLTNNNDSVIYSRNFMQHKPNIVLNYKNNTIRFDYDVDIFCQNNINFRYRITGSDWSALTTSKSKEYSDLSEGQYTFEVEAFSSTDIYATDSIRFEILPPWYRTIWAKIAIIILIIGLLILLVLLDRKRIDHKKRKAIALMDEKMETQEKEFEEERERQKQQIMLLEKEKLEFDLKHKSQEMANLMINIARKNEMLIEVKDEIGKVVTAIKAGESRMGSQQLVALNSKIESNIENDDLLKRVEEQFDIIHNNFIKKLSERYPDLSNNERMMCAYIKMDLSSKEMAPLLNISVRGVESMRYRLRKKFGLEREDGLTAFLNGIS